MVFGYTNFDPLVVIFGTLLAIWYLNRNAVKLIGFMPTALSLWFFIPWFNTFTLSQALPLVLTARAALKGSIKLPKMARPVLLILAPCVAVSCLIAFSLGAQQARAIIRIIYYLSLFAMFGFSYELGRKPEATKILLKGFVILGIVYSMYGAYQILAYYTELPVRGIVRDTSGGSTIAAMRGLPRVNSLANEPKRLGYVLFLSALACVFLARIQSRKVSQKLYGSATFIVAMSIMTFSSSYFLALACFSVGLLFLKPSKSMLYTVGIAIIAVIIVLLLPNSGILQAIVNSYDQRMSEFDHGIDNTVVYRQEFFAWDYLFKNPWAALFGVGLGQYYSVLNETYGYGAGLGEGGDLLPLNSNFLELVFDFGGIATLTIYSSLVALIIKLQKMKEFFYCYGILFLLCQSFTILTLIFTTLLAGLAVGRISK